MLFDLITLCGGIFGAAAVGGHPDGGGDRGAREPVLQAARAGLRYLWQNRGILDLIFFLATINLTASVYNAAFPAPHSVGAGGGETALGTVNAVIGVAMLLGSVLASAAPAPKKAGSGSSGMRCFCPWERKISSWPLAGLCLCGVWAPYWAGWPFRNERQHGCTVSQPHPSDHAGPGVCCPEYPPVFLPFPWAMPWAAGWWTGCLNPGWRPIRWDAVDPAVWKWEGFRCGDAVLLPGTVGSADLPGVPERPAHLGPGAP